MAVKSEDRRIGDHVYRVTQLTALKARALFARLIRFIGPAAAAAVASGKLNMSRGQLGAMIEEISARVTDDELGYFCDVLGSCTVIVGESGKTVQLDRDVLDIHFAGELLNMFVWLRFALEVNFADFLSVLKRTQAAASAAPGSPASKSPGDSIGTFGAS